MNTAYFLINTIFDLYLMVVLLRVWLQWARADFYNPMSQMVVKVTNPLVIPLRRIIPGFGGLDMASVLLALIIAFAKLALLKSMNVLLTDWLTQLRMARISSTQKIIEPVFFSMVSTANRLRVNQSVSSTFMLLSSASLAKAMMSASSTEAISSPPKPGMMRRSGITRGLVTLTTIWLMGL